MIKIDWARMWDDAVKLHYNDPKRKPLFQDTEWYD